MDGDLFSAVRTIAKQEESPGYGVYTSNPNPGENHYEGHPFLSFSRKREEVSGGKY